MAAIVERHDWYEHTAATTDWPAGSGARTASVGAALTPLGSKVILHSILPLAGAGGTLQLMKGDGTTAYMGNIVSGTAVYQNIDLMLEDGLALAGGTGGNHLVIFTRIK